ncbi:hypothetical protein SEVIR_9G168275v4 [Setaria viridis]
MAPLALPLPLGGRQELRSPTSQPVAITTNKPAPAPASAVLSFISFSSLAGLRLPGPSVARRTRARVRVLADSGVAGAPHPHHAALPRIWRGCNLAPFRLASW